jgi:hypothetical protein
LSAFAHISAVKLPEIPRISTTAAALLSSARFKPSIHTAELLITLGVGMLWITTALPLTSRPAKSAAVPRPTQLVANLGKIQRRLG